MVAWTSCRKTAVMIPHCLFTHLLRCTLLPPRSENLGQANLWIEAQDTLRTTDHATCISIEWLLNHESTYWKKSQDGTGKPNLQSPWGLSSGIANQPCGDMDLRVARSGSAGQNGHGCPHCLVRVGRARWTWMSELPGQARPGKKNMGAQIAQSGSAGQNGHGCPNFPARVGWAKWT